MSLYLKVKKKIWNNINQTTNIAGLESKISAKLTLLLFQRRVTIRFWSSKSTPNEKFHALGILIVFVKVLEGSDISKLFLSYSVSINNRAI